MSDDPRIPPLWRPLAYLAVVGVAVIVLSIVHDPTTVLIVSGVIAIAVMTLGAIAQRSQEAAYKASEASLKASSALYRGVARASVIGTILFVIGVAAIVGASLVPPNLFRLSFVGGEVTVVIGGLMVLAKPIVRFVLTMRAAQ